MKRLLAGAALLFACAAFAGAPTLRASYEALASELRASPFQRPLHIESSDTARNAQGDVYAIVDYPFAVFSAALADPAQWCDVLILHLNTKGCHEVPQGAGAAQIELRVGRKYDQPLADAAMLAFTWRAAAVSPDYLDVELHAPDGPYGTRDYRIVLEAVPVAPGRTFLHLGYAFGFGAMGHLAMHAYLATVGRDKVGFTAMPAARGGEPPAFVGGTRALVERNAMRYYLAIDAYLSALDAPPSERFDKQARNWFDASEQYPAQLHEVDRDSYLTMKRAEYRRQQSWR